MAVEAHTHPEIAELKDENEELKKKVEELEQLLTKVRAEVTAIKQFEWGVLMDPPTVKKDIC